MIVCTHSQSSPFGHSPVQLVPGERWRSELDVEMHEVALEILGWRAELLPGAAQAAGVGEWLDGYIFALAGPIYAGTNEIQRNVIAERVLGLPRK